MYGVVMTIGVSNALVMTVGVAACDRQQYAMTAEQLHLAASAWRQRERGADSDAFPTVLQVASMLTRRAAHQRCATALLMLSLDVCMRSS